MAVQTGVGRVYDCQITDCDRAADTTVRIWAQSQSRNEMAVCFPCATAIETGKKSERRSIW